MNIHRSLNLKKETKALQQNLPNLSVKRDQRQTFLAVHPIWGLIPVEVDHLVSFPNPSDYISPTNLMGARVFPFGQIRASGQVQSDSYLCSDFCRCAALICALQHATLHIQHTMLPSQFEAFNAEFITWKGENFAAPLARERWGRGRHNFRE